MTATLPLKTAERHQRRPRTEGRSLSDQQPRPRLSLLSTTRTEPQIQTPRAASAHAVFQFH